MRLKLSIFLLCDWGFDMKDFYNGFSDYFRIFCGSYRCAWHWFAFHYFRNNTLRAISYEH